MHTSTAWSTGASDTSEAAPEHVFEAALRRALGRLEEALPARDVAAAAAEARAAGAAVGSVDAVRVALATLLSEVFAACAARLALPAEPGLVAEVAWGVGLDPIALGLDVVSRAYADPRVISLPPSAAIDAVLALLPNVGPVAHASLWRRDEHGRARCRSSAGAAGATGSSRNAAQQLLASGCTSARRGLFRAERVGDAGDSVLVTRPARGAAAEALPFARAAARTLQPLLERAAEVERQVPLAKLLAEASERRVARLGFDLHDGPIQTLAALIGDTRLLASQVAAFRAGEPRLETVAGRVGDLQARMVALEFELRSMCHSLEAPAVLRRPLERVMEHEAVAFQRETGVRPEIELSGDFEALTPSQRITVLRVVQEALRNVREHSHAHAVRVRINTAPDVTEAAVEDDGCGFDVDAALARAVRDGRVGLIGMMERVRLLGGRCEVRSRPGERTIVSLLLPVWRA